MSVDNQISTPENSIKSVLLHYLKSQPENITIEEIQEFLFLKQQILASKKSIKEGKWMSHESVKEESAKWAK